MRVPVRLAEAFGKPFEKFIAAFATEQGLLPEPGALFSERFLSRSVAPHIVSLSRMFNRLDTDRTGAGPSETSSEAAPKSESPLVLDNYWGKVSSNRKNLRLAYFLYFMPSNLFRTAAVWSELGRLGFRWNIPGPLKGIDFGAGPAAGPTGVSLAESIQPVGLPSDGNWALIEADKPMLQIGSRWAEEFFRWDGHAPETPTVSFESESGEVPPHGLSEDIDEIEGAEDRPTDAPAPALEKKPMQWDIRPFPRKIDLKRGFLPPSAPKFHLWLMSYFLNELDHPPAEIARALADAWDRHLEEEGIAILVEPALRQESRKLLEIRKELVALSGRPKYGWLKLLLPCLGDQACGALARDDDWCHEDVLWWRPGYFRSIDRMAGLDRRSLPFSYLVFAKSSRSREELLPALASAGADANRYRLVSPSHYEGSDLEFYVCGQDGKHRARIRKAEQKAEGFEKPGRGDVLLGVEFRQGADESASGHEDHPASSPEGQAPSPRRQGSRRQIQRLKKRV